MLDYVAPMELPPPVFQRLPEIESIEPMDAPNVYRVTLREPGGEPKTADFTIWENGLSGATTDWDIFWRWPGDAESSRSVVRRVCEYHESREN